MADREGWLSTSRADLKEEKVISSSGIIQELKNILKNLEDESYSALKQHRYFTLRATYYDRSIKFKKPDDLPDVEMMVSCSVEDCKKVFGS